MTRISLVAAALGLLMALSTPARTAPAMVRGDANADTAIDLADPISTLLWLFLGSPDLHCLDAADVDDNGHVEITDAIRSLEYLFLSASPPASPFPLCGVDPSADALNCDAFPPCQTNAPPRARMEASAITGIVPLTVDFDASASTDADGQLVEFLWDFGDGDGAEGERSTHTFERTGSHVVTLTVRDDGGETGAATLRINVRAPGIPPDPGDVAPRLDGTSIPAFDELVAFLYSAGDPVQTGMEPGAITLARVAVLRGKVLNRGGEPLAGVTVRALNHAELGSTVTRADGMFDLVVNGGGAVVVDYQRDGFLPAQRQVDAPWQDYRWLSDVVLIPLDSGVTTIDPAGPMQVARGSPVTDADGMRQATLLFPEGTAAEMVMPDGSRQPLAALHVRATEYTVGEKGLEAMPADLPPTSGYTYCVELTVDEALAVGATSVRFSSPLPFYLENFLDFPVGTTIPLGGYDRTRGAWIPQDSGKVVKVVSVTGGAADLDLDGNGAADTGAALAALSITEAERQRLATLYSPGQSLWRVLIPHFSDLNLPLVPPDDAVQPSEDPNAGNPEDQCCRQAGNSIIEIQNQILGEAVAVTGTPFALHYQSERVPGRKQAYTLEIPLSGAQVPASLKRIEVEIQVAGQFSSQSFPPTTSQSTRFIWNGKNAYGQSLQGVQPVQVRIGYTYDAKYGESKRFGLGGEGISTSRARREVTLWRSWRGKLGAWDARGNGLGGWSLSAHHTYDAGEQTLYRGDGGRQSVKATSSTISTYAGTGVATGTSSGDGGPATQALVAPEGLAVGPDGSLYIASPLALAVRRVSPDGIIQTVAGNNNACPPGAICGDGGPATLAPLGSPASIALGPDGSLYIGEVKIGRQAVRKVSPDGIISTFAGTGVGGFSGDGGPATQAQIESVASLAVGPDQSVYLASGSRVRRVAPDGIISTFAGTGLGGSSGDGGPAALAALNVAQGIAVGRDGTLYIAESGAHRVRSVTPDGIIHTIAGTGFAGFNGDGIPAVEAQLTVPTAVAVGPDDTLYILDSLNFRVRYMRPGGTIQTAAGNELSGTTGDGGSARQANLQELHLGLAVGPDGSIYFSQVANNTRVRRISPVAGSFQAGAAGELIVPNQDGDEVYVFSLGGRHLRTLDALTNALLYRFNYDGAGRLIEVMDGDGNATTIDRDRDGNPTAIVGPYGQVTALELNADGFLARAIDPAGGEARMTYTGDGLLRSFTNPRGHASSYAYDAAGNLIAATDPTGATKTLSRSGVNDDYTVTMTAALGRTTSYRVETLENGDQRLTTTDCVGAASQSTIGADGRMSATFADGTRFDLVLGPDPRWGMRAPIAASWTTSTPGGLTSTITTRSTVVLAAPGDLLSMSSLTMTVSTSGRDWVTTYDGPSRTLARVSPAGRRERATLDEQGRPVEIQFGNLDPFTFIYDERGRIAAFEQGLGANRRVAKFTYGSDRFPTGMIDALGRTVSLTSDDLGRVTEQGLPGGRAIQFAYDANHNVRGITPPGRGAHSLAYSPLNQVISYTPPAAGAETAEIRYVYDADRNPTRIDYFAGEAVELEYENDSCRLHAVDLGARQRTYSYDAAGRIDSLSTSDGLSVGYAYDGGTFTGIAWSGAVAGNVTSSYDGELRLVAQLVNGGDSIAAAYDADSLPVQVGEQTLTRSAASGLIVAASIGALSDSTTYNGFGERTSFTSRHNGSIVYSVAYDCDAIGRVVEKTEMIGGATRSLAFAYDLADRLVESRQDGAVLASYSYDLNGNRLSRSDSGGTRTAAYDAQDRVMRFGSTTYTHNSKGERTSRSAAGDTTSYSYDGLSNLTGATLPDGTRIKYVLDARDRRVGKRVNGVLVQAFLYQDGVRPVAELDGAGNMQSRFVYATGNTVPDYMVRGGRTFRIITDRVGSPRLVIDVATGQVAQRMDHDDFGAVTLDTNPGFQPFGFAGGLYDRQTGLVHFGAREYDPETGRWTAKDPIGLASGEGNLYAYSGNDPINNVDPGGLVKSPLSSLCTPSAVALMTAVAGAVNSGREAVRNAGPAISQGITNLSNAVTNIFCRNPTFQGMAVAPPPPTVVNPAGFNGLVVGAQNGLSQIGDTVARWQTAAPTAVEALKVFQNLRNSLSGATPGGPWLSMDKLQKAHEAAKRILGFEPADLPLPW